MNIDLLIPSCIVKYTNLKTNNSSFAVQNLTAYNTKTTLPEYISMNLIYCLQSIHHTHLVIP